MKNLNSLLTSGYQVGKLKGGNKMVGAMEHETRHEFQMRNWLINLRLSYLFYISTHYKLLKTFIFSSSQIPTPNSINSASGFSISGMPNF